MTTNEFYATKTVVNDVKALYPGLRVTEVYGGWDGDKDEPCLGDEVQIYREPYVFTFPISFGTSLCVRVQRYLGGCPYLPLWDSFLTDRGIMPTGEKPYNLNRWIVGWGHKKEAI